MVDLGTTEDKSQEGIEIEITQLDLNLDQAIILYRAMISLSVESKTRKEALKNQNDTTKGKSTGSNISTEDLNRISEELNLIDYTEARIPYLVQQIKESIVYLQKEEDAIIKGLLKL